MAKFNINSYVRVRLTEAGRRAYVQHWACYLEPGSVPDVPVEMDGWSRFQLHELMTIFGSRIGNGLPLLFDTVIEIPDEELAALWPGRQAGGRFMTTAIARRILLATLPPIDFRLVAESVADRATGWESPLACIVSAAEIEQAETDRSQIRARYNELKGATDFMSAALRARLEFLERLNAQENQ